MLTANAPGGIGFSSPAGKGPEKGGGHGSSEKEFETLKRVADGPDFQKTLTHFDLPYDYKHRAQLEKEIPVEYGFIRGYLKNSGPRKKGKNL